MALIPKFSPILFAFFTLSIAAQQKHGEKLMRREPKREGQQKRALLALYGLQNRDRGCALPSHLNIQDQLQSTGFVVDTFVYEMMPRTGDLVDEVRWVPGSSQNPLHPSAYKSENVLEVDASIHGKCGETLTECTYNSADKRYKFPGEIGTLRELHSEQAVANYLKLQARNKYQLVVAISSDYVLRQNIYKADIGDAAMASNGQVLFVSPNAPFGGYTNGFYMGSVDAVATAMSRFDFSTSYGNYERQLKGACDSAGLRVRELTGHHPFKSIIKVRHNGNVRCYGRKNGDDVLSIKQCLQAAGLAPTWSLVKFENDDAPSGYVVDLVHG